MSRRLIMPSFDEDTPWRRRAWVGSLQLDRKEARVQAICSQAPESGDKAGFNPESLANPDHVDVSRIRMPPKIANDDAGRPKLEFRRHSCSRSCIRILGTRKQVAAILAQIGLQVGTCGQAEQAILQVLHERPDIVLAEIEDTAFDALALVPGFA